jgi:hypothetical protein
MLLGRVRSAIHIAGAKSMRYLRTTGHRSAIVLGQRSLRAARSNGDISWRWHESAHERHHACHDAARWQRQLGKHSHSPLITLSATKNAEVLQTCTCGTLT